MAYKRKGSRKYSKKKSYGGGTASADLTVFRNPFSVKTTNPKIPDGKVSLSSGVRLQGVNEFSCDSRGFMEVLLFPGLNNGVLVKVNNGYTADGTTVIAAAGNTWKNVPYAQHAAFIADGNNFKQPDGIQISQWRIVSQALRLTVTNNCDAADGWFEACRIQMQDGTGWLFGPDTAGSQTADQTGFHIATSQQVTGSMPGVPSTLSGSYLCEHPTYTSGKLKDIHKTVFQLKSQTFDHDFNLLSKTLTPVDIGKLLDFGFDAVYIRIHGRSYPNVATGDPSPVGQSLTRLMVHVVSNQEIVYDEQSVLSRYHTTCQFSQRVVEALKRSTVGGTVTASRRG